jgi:uncharacterized protein (TIGR00290 family)
MTNQALLAWSGGKDSALSLFEVRREGLAEVVGLLTTITEDFGRVSMHGIRKELLDRQARALGLPLHPVFIPKDCPNELYEERMEETLGRLRSEGIETVVFGDIYLEDLRRYREEHLARIGMRGLFPLWKQDTLLLAHRFIDLGFRAHIVCVDSHALDGSFVGRAFDKRLLVELPPTVDPCGEKGEFHSFVYDGPIFSQAVAHGLGEVALREERFYFLDILPS